MLRHYVEEHPRVRGENGSILLTKLSIEGTSPRARGKQQVQHREVHRRRNIPACAGKTQLEKQLSDAMQEHPRVRGENADNGGYRP